MEFMRDYPDDAACLEHLWRTKYAPDGEHAHCPKCDTERRFKKYATSQRRQSWTCTACGHHVHPTAGTIFHKSSTSLHLWFYAIYLMSSTRAGISAKQLEREIGVNYKTAHRMLRLIRTELMKQDDNSPMSGQVEADETWIGGKMRNADRAKAESEGRPSYGPYKKSRAMVFGMVERKGRVRAEVMPDRYGYSLRSKIAERVLPASMIFTDEYGGYEGLGQRYTHRRIKHAERVYVSGDVHTNTIEGFFGLVKNGIRGTYHAVSARHLQGYLNEYAWRYCHRDSDEAQFRLLLKSAVSG
jgi:transposase-like protein